jgi:hypothetical protein
MSKNTILHRMIAEVLSENYHVSATGLRNVSIDELSEIVRIIRGNDPLAISDHLDELHRNHPATIAINRSWSSRNCDQYRDDCQCFLPGKSMEDCWFKTERERQIEEGRKRSYPEYDQWRLAVFERDNFTCQKCGSLGTTLNAHHVKQYAHHPDLRLEVSNGTTLCESCHRLEHSK